MSSFKDTCLMNGKTPHWCEQMLLKTGSRDRCASALPSQSEGGPLVGVRASDTVSQTISTKQRLPEERKAGKQPFENGR